MNPLRLCVLLPALLAGTMAVSAQPTPLTLDECVALALENNVSVRAAQLGHQLAIERQREAFTNFFPSLSASAGIYEFNRDALSFDIMTLPFGFIKKGNMATVLATQPLFAGGRIFNGNKLARVGVDVSRIESEKTADEVQVNVEKYYWQVAMLQSKLATINVLDSLLAQLVHDVTLAVQVGMRLPNDLLQVQLRQNEVEINRLKVENGLRINKLLLAQYIGVGEVEIEAAIDFEALPPAPQQYQCDLSAALLSSADYRLLEKNVEARRLSKRLEIGKHLPTVAIGGAFATYDILEERMNRGTIFATVSVPLSDWWGGAHAIKQAKISQDLAQQELEDTAQRLIIRMQDEWNGVEEAYQQLLIAKKSISQSEENLRLNTNGYHAGTVPLADLLDAQTLFQQARDTFVDAFAALHITLSEYLKDTSALHR